MSPRRKQEKRQGPQPKPFRPPSTVARELDLHGLSLYDAETLICDTLELAWNQGQRSVRFIHGYKGGQDIRNFIRSPGRLQSWLKKHYPSLPAVEVRSEGQGSTVVLLGSG